MAKRVWSVRLFPPRSLYSAGGLIWLHPHRLIALGTVPLAVSAYTFRIWLSEVTWLSDSGSTIHWLLRQYSGGPVIVFQFSHQLPYTLSRIRELRRHVNQRCIFNLPHSATATFFLPQIRRRCSVGGVITRMSSVFTVSTAVYGSSRPPLKSHNILMSLQAWGVRCDISMRLTAVFIGQSQVTISDVRYGHCISSLKQAYNHTAYYMFSYSHYVSITLSKGKQLAQSHWAGPGGAATDQYLQDLCRLTDLVEGEYTVKKSGHIRQAWAPVTCCTWFTRL